MIPEKCVTKGLNQAAIVRLRLSLLKSNDELDFYENQS